MAGKYVEASQVPRDDDKIDGLGYYLRDITILGSGVRGILERILLHLLHMGCFVMHQVGHLE